MSGLAHGKAAFGRFTAVQWTGSNVDEATFIARLQEREVG